MGFYEGRFPEGISYGSSGGPGFDHRVIVLDSGAETIIARRSQAQRRYNAAERIKTLTDLVEIMEFYTGLGGLSTGFRWKDWTDFSTDATHRGAPGASDVNIGTGDGSTDTFQLKKVYTVGAFSHTRTITKPVSGTTRVSLDDTELPDTVGGQAYTFAVNTATGVVTISPAPANTLVVRAGCEFDVPVRFGVEVDQLIDISISNYELGDIPDIPLIEVLDPNPVTDLLPARGAKNHGDIASNITVTEGEALVHVVEPTTLNGGNPWQVRVPDASELDPGGIWIVLANEGSQNADLATSAGTTIITVIPGSIAEAYVLIDSGGSYYWAAK